jgi:hypothetical protein
VAAPAATTYAGPVSPDLPGNLSSAQRTPEEMRSEIEGFLTGSRKLSTRRLAAKMRISQSDKLFQEQLAIVRRDISQIDH